MNKPDSDHDLSDEDVRRVRISSGGASPMEALALAREVQRRRAESAAAAKTVVPVQYASGVAPATTAGDTMPRAAACERWNFGNPRTLGSARRCGQPMPCARHAEPVSAAPVAELGFCRFHHHYTLHAVSPSCEHWSAAPVDPALTTADLATLLDRAAPGADYLAAQLRGESDKTADRAAREATIDPAPSPEATVKRQPNGMLVPTPADNAAALRAGFDPARSATPATPAEPEKLGEEGEDPDLNLDYGDMAGCGHAPDALKRLSPEELAKHPGIKRETLEQAFAQGREDADALRAATPPLPGRIAFAAEPVSAAPVARFDDHPMNAPDPVGQYRRDNPAHATPAEPEKLGEDDEIPTGYHIAASVRGHVSHARTPGSRVAVCGEENVSPVDEPWFRDAYACKRCLRAAPSAGPSTVATKGDK